jgi:histidine ammonia-lyase
MSTVLLDRGLTWPDVVAVARGERLALSDAAWARIDHASGLIAALVERGDRAYGITTGVGALADTVVDRDAQARLSRNIVMSHACGVGPRLGEAEVRAIMTAQISNLAHGHSGVRREVIEQMLALLNDGVTPEVPSRGSVGYLTHNAHVALALIGEGWVQRSGARVPAADALRQLGRAPVELSAKEGLSLVNGTACATGLACVALARAQTLLEWADATAALTLEALGCQLAAFEDAVLALRPSPGIATVGETLRSRLSGSGLLESAQGRRTQDALSLRAVPQTHGMARDAFVQTAGTVDRELASVTDNPVVFGTVDAPQVRSEAHAVAPALAHAMDSLAMALAQVAQMSERRTDRLVNPLVSGLPAFLAADPGAGSGLMIAQYTASALASECRRLAVPASLDGGVTSALQEDFLAHPTAAASKLLGLLDNAEQIVGIELVAAAQAHDYLAIRGARAPANDSLYQLLRATLAPYADERPLGPALEQAHALIRLGLPPAAVGWDGNRGEGEADCPHVTHGSSPAGRGKQ